MLAASNDDDDDDDTVEASVSKAKEAGERGKGVGLTCRG